MMRLSNPSRERLKRLEGFRALYQFAAMDDIISAEGDSHAYLSKLQC